MLSITRPAVVARWYSHGLSVLCSKLFYRYQEILSDSLPICHLEHGTEKAQNFEIFLQEKFQLIMTVYDTSIFSF